MKNIFKKLIPDSFKQEIKIRFGAPHMYWSIKNLKNNGLAAANILDIGAYKGEWTFDVLKIFPDARYLLLEANPEREGDLAKFVNNNKKSKIQYEISLLASNTGDEKKFYVMDTASSVLEEHNTPINIESIVSLKTKRLEDICFKNNFNKVDLIKLDVQGYELEILKGGPDILRNAEAVLMEVSLIDIHKDVPLIREVINFMYDFEFVVYDICSVAARRPLCRCLRSI